MLPADLKLPDGWTLVEAATQAEVEERLPPVLAKPGKVALFLNGVSEAIDLHHFLPHEYYVPESELQNLGDSGTRYADGIEWLIVSGGSAPVHPAWVRSLRDQCQAAGVPFYFAGWGDWFPSQFYDEDLMMPKLTGKKEIYLSIKGKVSVCASRFSHGCPCDHAPGEVSMVSIGASRSGRMLDGKEWLQVPEGVKVDA